MRNNKGITLVSLIMYMLLTIIILGILIAIASNFRSNLSNMDTGTMQSAEFDKINIQFLNETKTENNLIDEEQSTDTKIVFANGNTYTYVPENMAIYLNNNIEIAKNVEECSFKIAVAGNKQMLTVKLKIAQQTRTTEYINVTAFSTAQPGARVPENMPYISGDKTAIIPAGFTVSGLSSENTIDGGLVIYLIDDKTDSEIAEIDWTDGLTVATLQKKYDQFVWVPIKNTKDSSAQDINDMYICQNKGTGSYGTASCTITLIGGKATCTVHGNCKDMAGRFYTAKISGSSDFGKAFTNVYTKNSGIREPDVIIGDSGTDFDASITFLNKVNKILNTNITTYTEFKNELQSEYNNIVKSVYENQGFYVGRYETSNVTMTDGTSANIVAGVNPTGSRDGVDWYYMYSQSRDYAYNNGLSVGSTMIQGAAYDQVMVFVDTDTYDVTTTGVNVSHFQIQGIVSYWFVYQTGGINYPVYSHSSYVPYNDVSKNIYDLEMNLSVWTTEAVGTSHRQGRGGHSNGLQAASARRGTIGQPNRGSSNPNGSFIGTLVMLYVQ